MMVILIAFRNRVKIVKAEESIILRRLGTAEWISEREHFTRSQYVGFPDWGGPPGDAIYVPICICRERRMPQTIESGDDYAVRSTRKRDRPVSVVIVLRGKLRIEGHVPHTYG